MTRLDQALEDTRRIIGMIGRELRNGRHTSGISLRAAGRVVDISHAQLGRIEWGEISGLTISQASRACAAIGLKLVVRIYSDSDAVLDTPQLALLERFRVPARARGDVVARGSPFPSKEIVGLRMRS